MRRLILILAVGIATVTGTANATASSLDRTVAGEDVSASMTSPLADLPPGGCVPYRVTIRNDRGQAGTWQFTSKASANGFGSGGVVFKQDMSVPANSSASFDVSIPLPVAAQVGSTVLTVGMTGPGFGGMARQFSAYIFTNRPRVSSPFAVLGNDVLGAGNLGPLQETYKLRHREFYGSGIDAEKLPTDWRAYSGIATLVLKDTEWLSLNAAQHEAVCDYVAQGGHLTLYTSDDPAARAPQLRLPEPDGKPGDYGFGTIFLESSPAFPVDTGALKDGIEHDSANSWQNVDSNFSLWKLREEMGSIAVSGTFIFLFVLLFGSLVGPFNLFVFARGKNRFRLFWTTPLISILASLTLVAAILIIDGIGGHGRQVIACYSLPGMTREAVIQEQVARTALLFSNSWHNDQSYLITPISENALNNVTAPIGYRMYSRRANFADSADNYLQQAGEYSGNWFRSRHVSGQYLQAVRPSRSVLTVLNPQALATHGAAPVVLSSFPKELDRVFLLDQNWHYWTCDHLEPGRKTTCLPSTGEEFNSFWNKACADAGGKLRPLLSRVQNKPGCFYATGAPPDGDRLATLSEIRWQVAQGIYLGPWLASTSPENNP
jgi:hypothetical protein